MGAGKTTTGKDLARLLNYDFLDLDQAVEDECGMKIPKIFEESGEAYFREKESGVIDSLKTKKHYVVSTGGGVWLKQENRQKLLELGLCIWLKVSAEKAFNRIESHLSQRPLIASSKNPLKTMAGLLTKREPEYLKAHLMVDTNVKNPKQVAQEIADLLKKEKPFDLRSMQK